MMKEQDVTTRAEIDLFGAHVAPEEIWKMRMNDVFFFTLLSKYNDVSQVWK